MTLFKPFYIVVLLTLCLTAVAQAADERDILIQKQMNCADEHLQQGSAISWNDVCDIPESYSQQHMQVVNQQLDQVEGNSAPQNVTQQNVAQQNVTQQNPAPQDLQPNYVIFPKNPYWTFEIAPEVSYIRYLEPSFMKESGVMAGLNGVFTFHPPEGDALNTSITDVYRLEGKFSYGKVDYHGGIQNGSGGNIPESFDGISDYMIEIRDLAGKDFNFNNQATRLTPYLGLGYRSLFDGLYANKPFGYNRHIQYFYAPFGAEVMTKLSNGWSIGADAEYDLFIHGFVTSYLGEIGYGDLQNNQKDGYGLRGSVKIVKNGDHFNLIFEPFVRYWNIHLSRPNQSAPFSMGGQEFVLIGEEPANTSLEIGGRFGVEF